MAIIAPNTDVYLLRNVPLNNDYENTFYFNSATEQFNYFYPKRAYTKVNYTFQRNNGMLRVDVPAESAMQCNYLMYRNTNYGNKWFYAFINNVHYVNNEMSEVEFELDVIQTWLFDFMTIASNGLGSIDNCFIERQHSLRDGIADNIIPEPVEVGEYVYNGNFTNLDPYMNIIPETEYLKTLHKMEQYIAVVAYADNDDEAAYVNMITYGVSGLKLAFFYPYTTAMRNLLTGASASGQPDAIKSIAYVPRTTVWDYLKRIVTLQTGVEPTDLALNTRIITGGVYVKTDLESGSASEIYTPKIFSTTVTIPHLLGNESIDGYTPRNKKLYTYPYNCLVLSDGIGENKVYKYELFEDITQNITFKWYGNVVPPIETYLLPNNYKNISSDNVMDKFIISNYQQGSWTTDAYQAWLARNQGSIMGGLINAGFSALSTYGIGVMNTGLLGDIYDRQHIDYLWNYGRNGYASKVPMENTSRNIANNAVQSTVGATGTALSQIVNTFADMQRAKAETDILGGNPNSNGLADLGFKGVFYNRMSIRTQYAERIDEFFTLYGYAQKIVNRPVLNARSRFTYVKTLACDIHPNIPTQYTKNICNIFNNGIRFWVDKEHFQNYTLPNIPFEEIE